MAKQVARRIPKEWFGDRFSEFDFSPGGSERSEFDNDMGTHTNETRYFENRDGERIVLAYSMAMNGTIHAVSLTTITFADEDSSTRLIYTEQMCVIPPSEGAEGRNHGWNALLKGLEGLED